jgi:hypothetical protein
VTQPAPIADRSSFRRVADALAADGRIDTAKPEQLYARCPSHDDGNASLSVTWRVDARSGGGRTYARCHAGCDTRDVLAAIGLSLSDLYDTPPTRPNDPARAKWTPAAGARKPRKATAKKPAGKGRQRVIATYPYCDADGVIVYEVTRWYPKEFTVRTVDSLGRRRPGWPAVERRMLYRLPSVLAGIAAGDPIFLTEGEKDADALTEAGAIATTAPGGAAANGNQARWHPQYTQALTGAHVVIVRDLDDEGRQHTVHLCEQLAPVAASVTVVAPAAGKDAADHLAAGYGLDAFVVVDPATLTAPDPADDTDSTPPPAAAAPLPAGPTAPTLETGAAVAGATTDPPASSSPAPAAVEPTPQASAEPASSAPAAAPTGEPAPAESGAPADAATPPTPAGEPVDLTRERRRRRGGRGGSAQPTYPVNVTFGLGYRYSVGLDDFDRGVYECKRDSGGDSHWVRRATLPYVHARIVRRDGTRRRIGTEYLLSGTEDSDRVVVTNEQLADGSWAVKIGANLSGDRNIITAVETAIRDHSHRHAPEQEATPRSQAHSETGHVDIPVAECMPNGYLSLPPRTSAEQARAVMAEVIEIVARHPKMALTMGASAGAPFVGPLRRQSHWWDLYGDSRKGKSTTQAVAASLWGDPRVGDGIVLGWDATSVGTGRFLGQLGILPPFFDERGLAPFDKPRWGEMVYSTCQGSSRLKAEADSAQGTHKSVPWFGTLFSTGNDRLTDQLGAGRFAGIPARVVELAAPFTEDHTEAKTIAALLARCYGWLGPAVLAGHTVTDVEALLGQAQALVGMPDGGVPGTIAEHLHMAVAGAMMIDAQVGTGHLLADAAVMAAREHLDAHSHEPRHDADRMVEALAESLVARRSAWPTLSEYVELSRPRPVWNPDGPARDDRAQLPQHGIDQQINGIRSDDGKWLYVLPSVWRELADDLGLDSAVACAKLYERGHLHVSAARKRAGEWQASPRMNGKPTRCYQLALFALDVSDDDTEPTPDGGPHSGPQSGPDGGSGPVVPVQPVIPPAPEAAAQRPAHDGAQNAAEDLPAVQAPDAGAAPSGAADEPVSASDGLAGECSGCEGDGAWCGFGATVETPAPCVRCGQPTAVRSACGRPRHAMCVPVEQTLDDEPAPAGSAQLPAPLESGPTAPAAPLPAGTPRRRSSSPRVATRKARQEELIAAATEELAKGEEGSLRFLAALEGEYAPMRRGGPDNHLRPPFWRPELPGITFSAHVVSSWSWSRRYKGRTVTLDRSGAWIAAASSVTVAHGELQHTGEIEFDGKPGYYQVQVHPWHFAHEAPHPLSGAQRRDTVWVPAPTMALLRDLAEQGRWADVTVLDSYTADGTRLDKWAGFVNQLRRVAITEYGRDSEQYAMVKEAFGMALSLMLGSPGESGVARRWRCAAQRPDWTHAIQAQASATLYRWAEACRAVDPKHAPVQLRNVDELVIPAAALDVVTTKERPGGLAPLTIDPAGIKLGSFKIKEPAPAGGED